MMSNMNLPKYFIYKVIPDDDGFTLEPAPTADVIEVVRCRECKYWYSAPASDDFNSCEMDALIRHENFFCANGERRDE